MRVRLHTGRRHQIRVHLSDQGYPLFGDITYGGRSPPWCPRVLLHARRLGIDAGEACIDAEIPTPDDFSASLEALNMVSRRAWTVF
mmetsp:Transcript_73523/g.170538  ORF Transcript_73523/g.170538 Transcript_73523/m.170538 type:complete len:86 (-) Transcript_73523:48-305(-)